MTTFIRKTRRMAAICGLVIAPTFIGMPVAAQQTTAQQTAPKHHSKLKGAVVGAAAGHVLGGHAKAGAAAGVLYQHHRNKVEKRKAEKAAAKP